jgi:hypothetical protein
LEHSKYASQALDLSKQQEETKQKEQMVKIKEYEAHIEQVCFIVIRLNNITTDINNFVKWIYCRSENEL